MSDDFLDQLVSDTGLTAGWILDILKNYDDEFKNRVNAEDVTKITALDISENKGYCSKIYKTHIYVDHQKEHVYNFVMKIPTLECIQNTLGETLENQEDLEKFTGDNFTDKLSKFHNVECDFYEVFKDFKGLPMPRVFYTKKFYPEKNQKGVIFMEDMSGKMQSLGIFNSLNVFQIKNIVKHLARFHAHLFEIEDLWRPKFGDGIDMFDDGDFIDMMKKMNDKNIEEHPEWAPAMKKLNTFLYDINMLGYSITFCCKDIGIPTMLQLGDLWTNNIMFEQKDDNIPSKIVAFLDFQLAFIGNPALDMARIITICTDAEIRRELEEYICDFYYENMTTFMKKNGKTPSFDVDQFKKAYDYAMINQVTWLPMMSSVFKSNHEVSEAIQEARMARINLRTKFALEDAVKKLEILQPKWVVTDGA